MLRPLAIPVFLLAFSGAQAQLNITELGHLDYHALRNSDLSNLWGYADEEGNEYALVGVNGSGGNTGGLSIVNVTDPANPQEIFFTPGPTSIWREIKVWNDHAYMTTEASQGLTIVDLSPLPQSTALPVTVFQGNGWSTAHSLFIDENGRLYLNGSNRGNGGSIFYDLTQDPMNPVEVGNYDIYYVHDCFARGDTLYAAHIFDGLFTIVKVSDPAAPHLLGSRSTPGNFTHNCWLDDTGHFLFTTDEVPNSVLASYDVSDPTDILPLDELQTDPGSDAIIHNTYWLNGYTVQSYYTEGVSMYDVTDPSNMVEVGHYDTTPLTGSGYNGAWGVYPFAPDGNLYVSDIERGLYILYGPNHAEACTLHGLVTDAQTTAPINNATATITATSAVAGSDAGGNYSAVWATAGTYQVVVSAPGYVDAIVENVVLVNGQATELNVELAPAIPFVLQGQVLEEGTNAPVPNASLNFNNENFNVNATADANGQFSVPAFYAGNYSVTAAHWGHHTICLSAVPCVDGTPLTLALPVGYADDFALDLGWTEDGNASSGAWERGAPIGTTYQGGPCAPGADVDDDCLDQAYVTGNGGGQAGTDDVDNGYTQLTSPEFDVTGMPDPWVRYYRWWFNGGGNGAPNDTLTVRLSNGNQVADLEMVTVANGSMGEWVLAQFSISATITPTSQMRFIVRTADAQSSGHLVEAGLDRFEVLPQSPFALVDEQRAPLPITVFPVPNHGAFAVDAPGVKGTVSVINAHGAEVMPAQRLRAGRLECAVDVPSGLYAIRVIADDGTLAVVRTVIER